MCHPSIQMSRNYLHDFGVIFAQRSFGSIVKFSSKISTNTGLAPVAITAFAAATKVNDGMRTPC